MVKALVTSMVAGVCLFFAGCRTLPYDAEGVPGWYWQVLSGESRWRVCGDTQAERIAETIRDTVYKPEGLWNDDIQNAENAGNLSIELYESPGMYSVVWSYPSGTYPRREIHFVFVCVDKADMTVVMSGSQSMDVDGVAGQLSAEENMPDFGEDTH